MKFFSMVLPSHNYHSQQGLYSLIVLSFLPLESGGCLGLVKGCQETWQHEICNSSFLNKWQLWFKYTHQYFVCFRWGETGVENTVHLPLFYTAVLRGVCSFLSKFLKCCIVRWILALGDGPVDVVSFIMRISSP